MSLRNSVSTSSFECESSNLVHNYALNSSDWSLIPEPILLKIFAALKAKEILNAGEGCRRWNEIARDDYIWRKIFQRDFKIDPSIVLKPGEYFTNLYRVYLIVCFDMKKIYFRTLKSQSKVDIDNWI